MNNYTAVVNLCKDPEPSEMGGRAVTKLRLADNTPGKTSVTLFFDAIVSGPDNDAAARLRKGDQVVIGGTLSLSEYRAKQGARKGQMIQAHEIRFAKLLQVTRSETFFAKDEEPNTGGDGPDPDTAAAADVDDPLADV